MTFRITARWESPDILPSSAIYGSPTEAFLTAQTLRRMGMHIVSLEVSAEDGFKKISLYRLKALYLSERKEPVQRRRRRNHIASILLGILASALPNSFEDFGVLSGSSALRAGRVTLDGRAPGSRRQ